MFRRRRRPRYLAEERIIRQLTGELSRTRRGRNALLVLALAALIALVGWWAWDYFLRRQYPVGPTVRVATWNLRQFSDRPGVDLGTIADVIRDRQFDVLAVQEVKQHGEAVDELLNVLGPPWRSTRLSGRTGNAERFTFIYNARRVREVMPARFIEAPEAGVFDRTPYRCTFAAGQFDFTLIAVHLSYSDTRRRAREAHALAAIAERIAQAEAEKDVIVLGDFNEEGRGNLHMFEEQGWELLNSDATNLSSRRAYDNLFIDPGRTREWSGRAGVIAFDESRFGGDDRHAAQTVSDHRPAYADFVVNLPDDD
jgi:endonuclease/exonuclease/phosphatase family metal-dependent hydrolase